MKHFLHDTKGSVKAYFSLPFTRLAIFPLLTLLVLIGMWLSILSKIQEAKIEITQESIQHTENIAHIFEEYTIRTVRQVDQITRFIAFENKMHGFVPSLQSLTENVLVSPASPVLLSLADKTGIVYESSRPLTSQVSIADREHFLVPKNNKEDQLFISKPVKGRVSNQVTIQVSRRVTKSDGSFDGVVIVSMSPSVFNSFYNEEDMGKEGFIGVTGTDGIFRSTFSSGHETVGNKVLNERIRTQKSGSFLTTNTHDKKSRFLAWRKLDGYNLIVVVGLSEHELMSDYYNIRDNWTKMGIVGSVAILAFGLLGTLIYGRMELKRIMNVQAKEAYRTASEGTQDGFFIVEPVKNQKGQIMDFVITDANDKGAQMFLLTPKELTGTYVSRWFNGKMGEQLVRHYKIIYMHGRSIEQPEVLVECNNPLKGHWLNHRAVATSLGIAITIRDITQTKLHEQSMLWLANHDAVTKLCNRTWLQECLPDILDKARNNAQKVALYFIDLDDFKKVNDTLGHAAGDALLAEVGQRLTAISRPEDVVCRLGGDEFTVVVQGDLSLEEFSHIGQRILEVLQKPIEIEGHAINVGASVGFSCFPEHGQNAQQLLKRADLAMYKAKDNGKGTCEVFVPALSVAAEDKMKLEQDIRLAIEKDEFFLVFQPKVGLKKQDLLGMEALIRWKSPTRGIVSPMDFIPLAEKTGLILPIGQIAINKACEQIVAWKKEGLTVPPVSVNVSPKQLQRVDLAGQLQEALNRYDLPASAIEIEITESSMMDDLEMSQRKLQAVKELGIRILVDDFGTGYSSLALLKRFEVDVLKVDKSFIQDVPHDSGDCALVQAVISMAQSLNMEVVAEGIETREQWKFLEKLGCHEGQGYYFSKPMQAGELNQWLGSVRLEEVA